MEGTHRLYFLPVNLIVALSRSSSHHYVNVILEKLPKNQLHLSTPIVSVGNVPDGTVQVTTADGRSLHFDRVNMACHSDTILELLKAGSGVTAEEEKILGRFTWNRNEVVLHNDVNVSRSKFCGVTETCAFQTVYAKKPIRLVVLELFDVFCVRTRGRIQSQRG